MVRKARRASAAATAGPRSDGIALVQAAGPPRAASAQEDGGGGAGAEALVRPSAVAPCNTCELCGHLPRDAIAFPGCLHAFCRKCLHDPLTKEDISCCPTCRTHLGRDPLEKLRSIPAKKCKFVSKKRKKSVAVESALSSADEITAEGLSPAASQSKARKIVVEVIDEVDKALVTRELVCAPPTLYLAPVVRDALARSRCGDFYSTCSLTAETAALIVRQPPPILDEMFAHDQLAPRQDPWIFGPPVTSDTEYQRQALAATNIVQTTNPLVVVGSSSHSRATARDDENLEKDILTMFNESKARIMGRYDEHIRQQNADKAKIIEDLEERTAEVERRKILEERLQQELENERAAGIERTRILEERLQRELDNEREDAVERIRILEERLQRESELAQSTASRSQALEAENARLYEELENERADNRDLKSNILEKSDELATLEYHYDMLELDKTYLENQVGNLMKELEYARNELAGYVRKVLNAASDIPNNLGVPPWL